MSIRQLSAKIASEDITRTGMMGSDGSEKHNVPQLRGRRGRDGSQGGQAGK